MPIEQTTKEKLKEQRDNGTLPVMSPLVSTETQRPATAQPLTPADEKRKAYLAEAKARNAATKKEVMTTGVWVGVLVAGTPSHQQARTAVVADDLRVALRVPRSGALQGNRTRPVGGSSVFISAAADVPPLLVSLPRPPPPSLAVRRPRQGPLHQGFGDGAEETREPSRRERCARLAPRPASLL